MQLRLHVASIFVFILLVQLSPKDCLAQSGSNRRRAEADSVERRFIKIEKIYVIGYERTRKSIITRELSVQEGGIYEVAELKRTLELDQQKLFNTRLFTTAEVTLLETSPGIGSVLVKVEERWYFFPSVFFRLADRNFNDWWTNRNRDLRRTIYGLRVDQYNLRGVNDRLKLVAQFGFVKQFELNYRMPYIDRSQKHGLIFGGTYNEWKNLAFQTEDHLPTFIKAEDLVQNRLAGYLTYSYRNAFYNFHYFTVAYQKTEIADTVFRLNPNYFSGLYDQQFLLLSYQFVRDRRDYVNYPLSGYYVTFRTEKSGLGKNADVNIWENRAQYARFWNLGKGFYFATNLTGLISTPTSQPYFLYRGLGYGKNYVRGFELDVVEGSRYLLTKNSFRKQLFQTTRDISRFMPIEQFQKLPIAIYAKLFFDGGYVQNYPFYEEQDANSRLTNDFIYGIGTGIDVVSFYDFVVRFEYSYNSQSDLNFFLNFKAEF